MWFGPLEAAVTLKQRWLLFSCLCTNSMIFSVFILTLQGCILTNSNFLFCSFKSVKDIFLLNREDADAPHQHDMGISVISSSSFCSQIYMWNELNSTAFYHFLWKKMRMMILVPTWAKALNKSCDIRVKRHQAFHHIFSVVNVNFPLMF